MQTLWRRAAQRCSCNCIHCHPSATALNRRATTAALKRRLRFRDIFTLFYSTFLASATVLDIGRKEAKKVEWENLIKEARAELKALQDQQEARIAAVSWPNDVATERTDPCLNDWSRLFRWATKERERRKSLGFQELKGVPTSLLKDASMPEIEELMSDKYITRLNSVDRGHLWNTTNGSRWLSVKKVKRLEWSIRKLVHRLILSHLKTTQTDSKKRSDQGPKICQLGTFAGTNSDRLRMEIDQCDRRLDFLRRHSSNTEYWYRFKSPDRPNYSRSSRQDPALADWLNPDLQRIFEHVTCDTRKDIWLANVCSVLLSSHVPPDVHTYNLLIIYLMRLYQMDDVEAVIESMNESHTRPNEVTLSAMLNFYTMNNNRQGFLNLLDRMDGQDGGLSSAHTATLSGISPMFAGRYRVSNRVPRTPVRVSEEEEGYYYEREGYKFPLPPERQPRAQCHSTRKVVERANMTSLDKAVYGAMICGSLQFLGPREAMEFYSRMVSDGWEAGVKELHPILEYHSRKLKWWTGLAVWQEICKLPEGPDTAAIKCMLWLCRRCQKHIMFGQVLDYGVRQQLIPTTVWHFTKKICGGNVTDLLLSADCMSSVALSASPITIARDFLDRSLEALGYRIASTALDLADITMDTPHHLDNNTVNIALKIYSNITRLHRDGPVSSVHTARQVALQRLAKKAGKVALQRLAKKAGKAALQTLAKEARKVARTGDVECTSIKIGTLRNSPLLPNVQKIANNVIERADTGIYESTPKQAKQLATIDLAAKTDWQTTEDSPAIHPLPSPPDQPTRLDLPPPTEQTLDLSSSISTPIQTPFQPTAQRVCQSRYLNNPLTLDVNDDTSPSMETKPAATPITLYLTRPRQTQPRLVCSDKPLTWKVASYLDEGAVVRVWQPPASDLKLGEDVCDDGLAGV